MLYARIPLLLLLLSLLCLVGCISSSNEDMPSASVSDRVQPEWISGPPDEEGYFFGIGLDPDLDKAKRKSQVNIAQQISTRIDSRLELSSTEKYFYSINKQLTDGVINGCKYFDQYYDGTNHWVLTRAPLNCVLDMTEAVLISYLLIEGEEHSGKQEHVIIESFLRAIDQINHDLKKSNTSYFPDAIAVIEVEGGSFLLGKDLYDSPGKRVRISPFLMSKYEVSRGEWDLVMNPGRSASADRQLPVNNVSWYESIEFCNHLSALEGFTPCYSFVEDDIRCDFKANGYRLPTEAEWEFAARGGILSKDFLYSGSDTLMEVGWYRRNSGTRLLSINELTEESWANNTPQAVGRLMPNELGLHDMSGNIREWCWDWEEDPDRLSTIDPVGRERGTNRGGSFDYWDEEQFRVYARNGNNYPLDGHFEFIGFRIVRRVNN